MLLSGWMTSKRRSTSESTNETQRLRKKTPTGPKGTQLTPSITPFWPSTVLSWPCSTRWMRAPTQTSAPRSPTHKRAAWPGREREHPPGGQWPFCGGGFACEKYCLTIKHRCVYQCHVDRLEFAVAVLS